MTKPTGRPVGRPPQALAPLNGKQAALEAMENLRSRTRAFRDDMSKKPPASPNRVYQECKKIARMCSPEMMWGLVNIACTDEDSRVAYLAMVAVLDRAGIRPIDFDPDEETREIHKLPLEQRKARLRELIDQATELVARKPGRGLVD